ncbi:hypothetical protein SADUNF_Sadunf17G0099800 [Salix dunnii]|uniref:Uncharacterized protein n=1 Tax=Salix dunnii TaxID=1413687 RepID=A0A835J6V6_9ROSI|nr:hypothetical protein SADUNF_Sadunf17G0099800 [Salix dunnii]
MGFVACVAFSVLGESPSLFFANERDNYPSLMGISCNSIQVLSDHLWLFYLSFDYLKELIEWHHESLRNIELSFHSSEQVKVKNCGLFLLYSLHSPLSSQSSSYEDPLSTCSFHTFVFCSANNNKKKYIPVIRGVDTSNAFTHSSTTPFVRGTILDDKKLEKRLQQLLGSPSRGSSSHGRGGGSSLSRGSSSSRISIRCSSSCASNHTSINFFGFRAIQGVKREKQTGRLIWRNVAKQATLKSQSTSLNFPPFPRTHSFLGASKEPIFFGKFKFHSLNNTSPRPGFRAIGGNINP